MDAICLFVCVVGGGSVSKAGDRIPSGVNAFSRRLFLSFPSNLSYVYVPKFIILKHRSDKGKYKHMIKVLRLVDLRRVHALVF